MVTFCVVEVKVSPKKHRVPTQRHEIRAVELSRIRGEREKPTKACQPLASGLRSHGFENSGGKIAAAADELLGLSQRARTST